MTTKLEQAARQALEALEVYEIKLNSRLCNEAITALREALAEQAEQEPEAWGCRFQDGSIHDCICPEAHAECEGDYTIPLYTQPVRTKDLTDDEIMKINVDTASIVPTCDRQFHFARAVIAAYKEKNK